MYFDTKSTLVRDDEHGGSRVEPGLGINPPAQRGTSRAALPYTRLEDSDELV